VAVIRGSPDSAQLAEILIHQVLSLLEDGYEFFKKLIKVYLPYYKMICAFSINHMWLMHPYPQPNKGCK
jgi:hypothetical protein